MSSPARLALLQRCAFGVVQVGLLLPLVTVRGCGQSRARTVTGLEHYFLSGAWPVGAALVVLTLGLVLYPWRGGRAPADVAAAGLRAWTTGLGAAIALLSPTGRLFESTTPRAGYVWHGGGWTLLYLGYFALTARLLRALPRTTVDRPVPAGWGVVALGLGPPVAVALGAMARSRGPEGLGVGEALALLLCAYAFAAPLALGGVGLVRARQAGAPATRLDAGWWLATGLTLLCLFGAAANA